MWIAYMDEAGNTGRNLRDPNQPIHLILTMAVDESCVRVIHEHVRDVARRHCSPDCNENDFELHGKELFAGEGYFASMPPEKRVEIYEDALAVSRWRVPRSSSVAYTSLDCDAGTPPPTTRTT